jgi:hypothetical protein
VFTHTRACQPEKFDQSRAADERAEETQDHAGYERQCQQTEEGKAALESRCQRRPRLMRDVPHLMKRVLDRLRESESSPRERGQADAQTKSAAR